ncbi:MAG: hypothetical protein R2729_29030 [Bryobacteraceae bacterium]
MTTVEIPRLNHESEPQFLSDYFATLSLYDLSRQWLAKPGPFRWDRFFWKPNLTEGDVDRLKGRFAATYGVSLDHLTAGSLYPP